MSDNGWGWIKEGERISEQNRQARAGAVDVEAVKAESLVFDTPTLTLRTVQPADLIEEIRDLKNEVDVCRDGYCENGYEAARLREENERLRSALNEALTILGEV